jgi:hypothetical protein
MKLRGRIFILGLAMVVALSTGALGQTRQLAWDGAQWKEFPQAIKVVYVKGVLNMAAYETASGGAGRGPCISKAFTEELKTKTMGQVVNEVDAYYKDNPGKMNTPVIDVLLRQCSKLCPPEKAAEKKK